MALANPAEWELPVLCSICGGPSADDLQHADERERLDLAAFRLKRHGFPLRRKAAAERQEQTRRSLDANLPPEQRPHDALLLGEEPKPGERIGDNVKVGIPGMVIADLQRLVANYHGCLALLPAGKREVVGSIETLCLMPLKHIG